MLLLSVLVMELLLLLLSVSVLLLLLSETSPSEVLDDVLIDDSDLEEVDDDVSIDTLFSSTLVTASFSSVASSGISTSSKIISISSNIWKPHRAPSGVPLSLRMFMEPGAQGRMTGLPSIHSTYVKLSR